MYRTRHIEEKLRLASKHFKVVLIVGPRQVGKSTILRTLFPHLQHITFDPVQDLHGAKADPDLFLRNFPSPIILDEIQYAPQLLPSIKRKVDEQDFKGQYFLTGSQNISILKNIAESLAGRVVIIQLGTMTTYEIHEKSGNHWLQRYLENPSTIQEHFENALTSTETLYERLWRGNFPGVLDAPNELIAEFMSSYVQTYVERDVRLVENIKDLGQFDRFLGIAAALTAQEVNDAHLGREIELSPSIAHRWLDLLKYTYLWIEVFAFSNNMIKRVSKKRKGYIADTGLACYLQRIPTPQSLAGHPMLGSLFESFVVSMIMSTANGLSMAPKFYHWRTNGGAEVDFLLEFNNTFYPIEVKCRSNVTHYDARGVNAFRETYPHLNVAKALIVYAGDKCYSVDKNTIAMPWNGVFAPLL